MRRSLADLRLDSLTVFHAGQHSFKLAPRVVAVPWTDVPKVASGI
jgi:hypothetical protein